MVATADEAASTELATRSDLTPAEMTHLIAVGGWQVVPDLLDRLDPHAVPRDDPAVLVELLAHPEADPEWARQVARHDDVNLRWELARRPLPRDVLELLARDPEQAVVIVLAASAPLPQALADELAAHPEADVRRALLFNRHIRQRPPTADLPADLAELAAANPNTPGAEVLAGHPAVHVRQAVARRTDLPVPVYEQLARDPLVRPAVAGNPAAPPELLTAFARDTDRDVLRELTHNPAIPLALLIELAPRARTAPVAPPRVAAATDAELRVLATHPAMQVRKLAAERADLPADVIALLAADPDPAVAAGVLPQAGEEHLRAALARHGERVHRAAAANPACPPDLLEPLTVSPQLARHPHTPATALVRCLADPRARQYAARHPCLPLAEIRTLLDDRDTARSAAMNPALPIEDMWRLWNTLGAAGQVGQALG
jgi:hypothetical protein